MADSDVEENAEYVNGDEQTSEKTTTDYKKRVHTAVYYCGFFVFGWVVGQRGAAFLDLLLVTDTDVTTGSILFTLAGLASIAGGLAGGFLLDLTGRPLLMMTCVFMLNAAVNSTLALCKPLTLMATLYFFSHFALSIYDVVVNPHVANIWPGTSSSGVLQGLHFMFSVGAVLSPLATQPFLVPRSKETHLIPIQELERKLDGHTEDHDESVFANDSYNILQNVTGMPGEDLGVGAAKESRVLYALMLSGGLCLISGVSMMMLMAVPIQTLKHQQDSEEESAKIPTSDVKKLYYAALVMLGVYNFFGSSVEDVFPHYLMTFVVRELDWSKSNGARVTSVYWVGLAVGRLSGVGLVKLLPVTRIILGCLASMITSLLALLLASVFQAHWAVWVSAGWVGLSTSILFPSGLIYAHQRVARLTGKVAALIFTTPMMAAMVNPLVLATLMTRYSNLWYVYIFILQTVLALACFLLLHRLSSKLAVCRSRTHHVQTEMPERTDKEMTEPFLDRDPHAV